MKIAFEIPLSFLWEVITMYVFWIAFCSYIALKTSMDKKMLPKIAKIMAYPFLLTFGAIDILINYILGTIIFYEFPRRGEWTFSKRVSRYDHRIVTNPNKLEEWRTKAGTFIANILLNPIAVAVSGEPHV